MKTPTINSRILKLEVLKGTATRTSVNAVESRTTSLESDVATAQSDISTLQGDVATLTQGSADAAVSTHNTAPDSHADIRTALAGKQDAGSFAGSSTPGGAATTALACTGNAATATTAADSSKLGGQPPSAFASASHAHSGYETAIGNPSANGYLLSSTSAGVRSWVAPYSHPATHAQSVIASSSGWVTTALAGKQAAGSYLTTTGTAADSAKLGGVAASGYSQASHVHNYAGSSSPGGAATTALACTGNSATATALAVERLINGTSFNGSSDVIVSKIYDANYTRIQNPGGGVYTTTTEVISGAIAVQFPVSMIDSMMRLTIKVYEYTTGESFECVICGYMYTDNTWSHSPTAYIIGNPNTDRRFNIRYGYNSSIDKAVVYIGELNSAWSYPQVYVTDVQIGYGGFSSSWLTGWQIFFEATAFENVTATVTDCQVGYRPANAFTGAKVIGGTTCNFVNGLLVS